MARISRKRGEFEAEHLVEEDLAVEVGVGEAVGARIELLLVLARLEPERIEIGVEVAADAVGADQHQRVDRIARRLLHVGGRKLDALGLRLRLDLVADRLLDLAPVAVSAATSSPRGRCGQFGRCQDGPLALFCTSARSSFRPSKNARHSASTAFRVGLVAGVEVFDIGGVAAIKERGAGESRIRVLARHAWVPVGWGVVGPHYDRRHESSGPFTFILFMLQLRCDNWQKMNSNSRADGAVAQPAHASPVQGARGQKGGFRRLAVTRCLLRARRGLRLSLASGRASRGPSGLTGFSAAISISRRPGCRPSGS